LLLNVGPNSDGTIPEAAEHILVQLGAWLKVNGEAIYGTRPWITYGEGPTRVTTSALNTDRQDFTPEDIRFTTHGDVLYAIALGWPEGGKLRIRSLWRDNPYLSEPVGSVQLLGTAAPLRWKQDADGLYIELPDRAPDEPAFAFRIVKSKNGKSAGSKLK